MSRAADPGFAVMDVSTGILDDEKFRDLAERFPAHAAVGVTAFLAALARSWKKGRRVTADRAWPVWLPKEPAVIDALQAVGLLDRRGMVAAGPWREWFEPARKRRDEARARWRKSQDAARKHLRVVTDDSARSQPLSVDRPEKTPIKLCNRSGPDYRRLGVARIRPDRSWGQTVRPRPGRSD